MKQIAVALVLVVLVGCEGEPTGPGAADRAGFDAAVADYLQSHHMDLKIEAYKRFSLSEDGQTASAEIAMGYAGGMMKATARFNFDFEKVDGAWRVKSHQQK